MKKTFLLLVVMSIFFSSSVFAAKGKKAILIGVQNYKNYAKLESCHGDVEDMTALLKQAGFEDDYMWIVKDDYNNSMITASDLYSNITAFARGIQKGDKVIFFFSGHGIGDKSGNNYLLGFDGNMDAPKKFSVNIREIKTLLKEKNPSEIVMIIDACRNYIKKEGRGAGKEQTASLNTGKGVRIQAAAQIKPDFQAVEQTGKLGDVNKTIVKTVFAASEGQQSFERKDKNNGAFTYYLTYLVDSPNSAIDVDINKDGIISVEDMVSFADNRISDYCKRNNLPEMNPVYQTDGGVLYQPFLLFKYNPDKEVKVREQKKVEPVFQYDLDAELKKIKKAENDLSFLNEQLPEYKPEIFEDQKIDLSKIEVTDVLDWKLAMNMQEKVDKQKAAEKEKQRIADDKKALFEYLKEQYNATAAKVKSTESLFNKFGLLEEFRLKVNEAKYADVKQKILVMLEPVYQEVKNAKEKKSQEVEALKETFAKDVASMEEMKQSKLDQAIKDKYIAVFKDKWFEFVKFLKDEQLKRRFYTLLRKQGDVEKIKITRRIIGLSGKPLQGTGGILIDNVTANYPAANAGIRAGDIIVSVNDKPVYNLSDINREKNRTTFDFLNIAFIRNNSEKKYVKVDIKEFTDEIEMVYIDYGEFIMGDNLGDDDEKPAHKVRLDGYWIGKYEVTQEQWQAVMGNNPAKRKYGKGNNYPVYNVSWNDCQEFIQKLNRQTSQNFALPTEAQWEYAARGGPLSKGYVYSGSNNINDVAEYYGNNNISTKPVGGRQANELGIYDMSGNVLEWCGDWYGDYPGRSVTNPTGPSSGSYRVNRGGSWYYDARNCRSAVRFDCFPSVRFRALGFRLVRH